MWITFSVSAQESGDSTSEYTPPSDVWVGLLAQSAWWRGKPSQSRWWVKRCSKVRWLQVLCGSAIWPRYPLKNFHASTGTSVATPVNRFPKLGNCVGSVTLDTFGPSFDDRSLLFGQEDSSSRTSPTTGEQVLTASSETWRQWGTALLLASTRREKSAHLIGDDGFSCSPSQQVTSNSSSTNETCRTTSHSVAGWPTPTTVHASRQSHDEPIEQYEKRLQDWKDGKTKGRPGESLGVAVRMWPTPTARDWKDTPGMSPDRNGKENGRLDTVSRMVFSEAGLHDRETSSKRGSRPVWLNPDWVDCLMGFAIGWTDLEHWETPSFRNRQNARSSDCGGS